MTDDLEKIDIIRARLGVSYKDAKEALDAAGGDVVKALIDMEEKERNVGERFQVKGHEMVGQLKTLLKKGQNYRVKVKQGDKTVLEFPASVGALGIVGTLVSSQLAILGALGGIAAMSKNYTLELDRLNRTGDGQPAGEAKDSDI